MLIRNNSQPEQLTLKRVNMLRAYRLQNSTPIICFVIIFQKPRKPSPTMPPRRSSVPNRLEDQCLQVYLNYLNDECHMLFYLKNFHHRSVLLSKQGLAPDRLYKILQNQLSNNLKVNLCAFPLTQIT